MTVREKKTKEELSDAELAKVAGGLKIDDWEPQVSRADSRQRLGYNPC